MKVFIQREEVDPHLEFAGWFVAARGFSYLGDEIEYFKGEDVDTLELDPECPVVGGVGRVIQALNRLGVKPDPLDYPESLHCFLGRAIRPDTLGEARKLSESTSFFMKPRAHEKAFTGTVVSEFRHLIPTASFTTDTEIWISDVLHFQSEWRVFVRERKVRSVRPYTGNPLVFPSPSTIHAMVDSYENAPVSYALDVGVTNHGETKLVEVNDAFSLGDYGLNALEYAAMIETRWRQLMTLR